VGNPALRRQAPDYPRLAIPVEIISGMEDPIIEPRRHPIPFAGALRHARLTLVPGVGHMAHHAAPDEVLAALDRIDPPA
jgi:pimeloyl-ACP methyl ester carboxylesterase